uniref:UV-stimulated scaffold protein A n=1 Tax=Astyanax mexicanus TaxID=7994 RepID=A0A8B9KVN9_ASTMX
MDQEKRDKLSELVEELTTSGEPQLNEAKMKEVKKICKLSNDYIDHFYHLIMTQLNQDHAEIRLSAFQMASELFSRSHHFRVLLVSNLQEFLELTVETDVDQPLPPPKEVAKKLKVQAMQTVQTWQATYGDAYKKLALGYHFLKQVKKVDFQDVEARTLAERKRQEEKQQRLERIYKEKLEKAKQEMEEMTGEMEESLTEMNNCLVLLMPDSFSLFSSDPAGSSGETQRDAEQPCCSKELSSETERPTADEAKSEEEEEESDEEADLEEPGDEDMFIRSTGLMSHRYQLDLDVSMDLNLKETEENEAVVNNVRDLHRLISSRHLPMVQSWIQVFTKVGVEEQLIRRATEIKKSLDKVLRKHDELHIDYKTRQRRVFSDVYSSGLDPLPSTSSSVAKPETLKPAVKAGAPPRSLARLQRKLRDEEMDPTCAAATVRVLKNRLPSVPSTSDAPLTPVECRLAHASSDTCEVRLRLFLNYWRDPELMREIEAATGEDLGSSRTYGKGKKGGKGKGKRKKHPNLTDLKQTANTSRSRLEKKVFNKSSMRRVAEVMNKIDKRKHEKFANQFNYVFK